MLSILSRGGWDVKLNLRILKSLPAENSCTGHTAGMHVCCKDTVLQITGFPLTWSEWQCMGKKPAHKLAPSSREEALFTPLGRGQARLLTSLQAHPEEYNMIIFCYHCHFSSKFRWISTVVSTIHSHPSSLFLLMIQRCNKTCWWLQPVLMQVLPSVPAG